MRRTIKEHRKYIWCLLVLACLLLVWPAFAGAEVDAADRDVEWGQYQNSRANNGIIGEIETPVSYEETALKWSRKMVSGFTTSFTPPLIIDGYLYTASSTHVYKVNRDTGEIVKESAELKLNVGYGINPITYDEDNDQLYVPILKGRVQCLDAETLDSKWISEEYSYSQSLSPISYIDGSVYTGIWETETKDGVFFCLDAATGEAKWKYIPSKHGEAPHGFYWAGSYVDDRYVVVGSDDGAANTFAEAGAYPETATVYCFDRKTGEVKDRITGIKGDIRSTVVYDNGHIYFVSKGGRLYKTSLGADGKFSDTSFIQLTDSRNGVDAMMTSTPVVYKGRIYVGAAGNGGQYSADGGHFFAVIADDATLKDSSLIYTVPISGYPQAAPLLSTATEKTDGKVRLYFTFNAFPGGIYCLEDSQSATAENHASAKLLYRPEISMQQYCISPLCCDREGTFYYKNDSGYLMAVAANKAYLNGISVRYGNNELKWEYPFESGLLNYDLQAPNDAKTVDVRLQVPEGMSASVDGKACTIKADGWTNPISVAASENAAAIPVVVSRTVSGKTYTRTYTLNTATLSNNANLAEIVINASNTRAKDQIGYDPAFDAGVTDYVSRSYDGDHTYLNLWLQTADPEAQVRVLPANNVGNSAPNFYLNEDGSIEAASNGRYPVYWVTGEITSEVDVEVTAPSGMVTKTYHVTFVRGSEHLDVGRTPLKLSPSSMTLYTSGQSRSAGVTVSYGGADVTGDCTFESTDPAVAMVDPGGIITAVSRGDAEVWVRYAPQNRRARVHVEVTDPTLSPPTASLRSGTYTEPIEVALTAPGAGADVRYVMGAPEEDLAAPTSTGGTKYEAPIGIGEPGKVVSVKIRAIACGEGYAKSYPEDFIYTVDLTGGTVQEAGVSLSPGSIYIAEEDQALLAALPNGTGYEAVTAALSGIQAHVIMNEAYAAEHGGETEILAGIVWNTENGYDYDPANAGTQRFLARGQVALPDGIDSRGRSLEVMMPVGITAVPPGKVTAVSAVAGAKTKSITVTYKAVPGAEGYKIAYRKTGSSWKYKQAAGTTCKITGLAAGGCYEVRACAVNSGGEGALSKSSFCMIAATTLKVTAGKKSFTAKMKATGKASGYQVRYSLKKTMAGAKTKKTKKTSLTVKKLKAKKVYYVEAAPYKVISGKTYVGESVVKKVKTK